MENRQENLERRIVKLEKLLEELAKPKPKPIEKKETKDATSK